MTAPNKIISDYMRSLQRRGVPNRWGHVPPAERSRQMRDLVNKRWAKQRSLPIVKKTGVRITKNEIKQKTTEEK